MSQNNKTSDNSAPEALRKRRLWTDTLLPFFAYLFMIGGIGGFIANCFFEKKWISILSFISFLPMINVWIWQWLENKKDKSFANKVVSITALISVCAIGYVFNIGELGIVPRIVGGAVLAAYFLWIVCAFSSAADLWWQKALVVIAAVGFISWAIFIRAGITTVDCNRVSNIVHMDIFENLTPPVIKKDLLKEKGVPENIAVDYEEEDDGDGGYYRYKVEIWEYVRDTGNIEVIFIDDDYADGYIGISPIGLHAIELLKDTSLIRYKSKRAYKIVLKAENNEKMELHVNRDNAIRYISYSSD